MTVGQRIRQRRERLGLGVRELARRADISPSYVTRLEHATHRPGADIAERLAHALETTVGDLLGDANGDCPDTPTTSDRPTAALLECAARYDIRHDDMRLLHGIAWRGRQPQTVEDWWFLYQAIVRACHGNVAVGETSTVTSDGGGFVEQVYMCRKACGEEQR